MNTPHYRAVMRVLVVDDSEEILRLVDAMLGRLGHHCRTANSGEQACQLVRSWMPEFIFLDISMPGIDGYQTASILRNRERIICRICALTAYEDDAERRFATGIDFYIRKPVTVDQIANALSASN